jgi:hypothetical protein
VARRRRAAVLRKTAWFGSGGGRNPEALYLIGPHAELVGTRAAALQRADAREDDAEGPSAAIDEAADLRDADPESDFIPGQITGVIEPGHPGGGRQIALAVNGVIVATGRTFSLDGSPQAENFEMIVRESAFHRGRNQAQLFEIVPRGGRPTLRPLT